MKKKRNLLTIISSILGCVAICGFSMFGLFSRSIEKSEVKADDTELYSDNFDYSSTITYYTVPNFTYSVSYVTDFDVDFYYYSSSNGGELSYVCRLDFTIVLHISNIDYRTYVFTTYANDFASPYTNMNVSCYIRSIQFTNKRSSDNTSRYHVQGYVQSGLVTSTFSANGGDTSWGSGSVTYAYGDNGGNLNAPGNPFELFNFSYTPGGYEEGYNIGYGEGYDNGYNNGYNDGYQAGVNAGNSAGYETGYQAGVDSQQSVIAASYQSGYSDGYNEGHTQDSTVATIFSGILQVAMVPVNFFLSIFNFEILGINLSSFIQALFTIALTIIVLKTVLGKGGGSSDN